MPAVNYSSLVAQAPSNQSNPDFYLDGDYSKAIPIGLPMPEFPFLDQHDTETVIFRQPMVVALRNYAPLSLLLPAAGFTSMYCLGDVSFKDGKCGLLEFERLYANIPKKRTVSRSFSYAFQKVTKSGAKIETDPDTPGAILSYEGPTYELSTVSITVDSTLTYEYFLAGHEDDYPLAQRARLDRVGNYFIEMGSGHLYVSAGYVCSKQETIIAEDDAYDDWRGGIRFRVRRTIKAPTPQFWASQYGG